MSTSLYARNAILAAKIETTYGTDSTPTAAANAMRVRDCTINPLEGETAEMNYIRNWFGANPLLRTSKFMTAQFSVDWATGSGAAGTASPYDPLFRACGQSSSLIAAAVTGTAQTGSTTSTIKLASGASSTNNLYRGGTVTITGGTGSGQSRGILAYDGTTKIATITPNWVTTPDATSTYSIGAMTNYDPVSSGMEGSTLYYWADGLLHKLVGCRGSWSLSAAAKGIPDLKFNMTALYGGIVDNSPGTPSFSAFEDPLPVNSVNTSGSLLGKAFSGGATGIQVASFTLDLGAQVTHRSLIGSESVPLTNRNPSGQIDLEMSSVAFYDWNAAAVANSTGVLALEHGTVAAAMVRVDLPRIQIENLSYSESDGIVMASLKFRPLWTNGNDELRLTEK